MLEIPTGLDDFFHLYLLKAWLRPGNLAAGGKCWLWFPTQTKLQTCQRWGRGREWDLGGSVGAYVSSGVEFYMSGFHFHRAPLSAITVLFCTLTGRPGSVSKKSV